MLGGLFLAPVSGVVRRPPRLRVKLALVVASIVLGAYLVEIAQFVLEVSLDSPETSTSDGDAPFDTRSKFDALFEMREQGVDIWPTVSPGRWTATDGVGSGDEHLYPLGGISNERVLVCNEGGEFVIHDNDEHGFNNPPGIHAKSSVDIAVIGDSFAQGWCVSAGEDIGNQLRRSGPSVLNLGKNGIGPLIELAILKEFGLPVRPRVVLWLYYEENDLTDLQSEREVPLLMRYHESDFSQALRERQPVADRLMKDVITEQFSDRSTQRRRIGDDRSPLAVTLSLMRLERTRTRIERAGWRDRIEPREFPLEQFESIVDAAERLVTSNGGHFYFVYLPMWQRYALREESPIRSEILGALEDNDIHVIDFHEVLSGEEEPVAVFPFRRYGHYTVEGYALLAETILARLAADNVLSEGRND